MKDSYDVLVVGGGPGGAVAAKTAAEAGLSVLLVEKRPAIGVPVRCAEGVWAHGLAEFLELDPKWISSEIASAVVRGSEGTEFTLKGSPENTVLGYTLDRKLFDRELVWRAAEAGAEIQVHARVSAPIFENGCVSGAVIQQHGVETHVRTKIVIAADGVESKFAKWAGIDTTLSLADIESCAQYLVNDIDIDEKVLTFFFSSSEAPGGYIWIFPKGLRCANIGVGILGTESGDGHRARDYLDAFIKKQYPNGKITELMVGGVSVSQPLSCMVSDGLMIVGDAARLSDPITGWGTYQALVSGRLAGEVAVEAIQKGDVSRDTLMAYDKKWRESWIGKVVAENYTVKESLTEMDKETLKQIFYAIQKSSFENIR